MPDEGNVMLLFLGLFVLPLVWAVFGTVWGFLIGCCPQVWWADRFRLVLFFAFGSIALGVSVWAGVAKTFEDPSMQPLLIYAGAGPVFWLVIGRVIRRLRSA